MAPMMLYSTDHAGYSRTIKEYLTGKVGVGGIKEIVVDNITNLRDILSILKSEEFQLVSCRLERFTRIENMGDGFKCF